MDLQRSQQRCRAQTPPTGLSQRDSPPLWTTRLKRRRGSRTDPYPSTQSRPDPQRLPHSRTTEMVSWLVHSSSSYSFMCTVEILIREVKCDFRCVPQSLTWQDSLLTTSLRTPGSRWLPPMSSVRWASAPRCCSTPATCTAATSAAAAHRLSSLWTAAPTTPPPPTPTTVSPVTRCAPHVSLTPAHTVEAMTVKDL